MATLKELREQFKLTKSELSKRTGINQPVLSNYESHTIIPTIEDICLLEKEFHQPIDWEGSLSPEVQADINVLLSHYPTASVINFLARYLRKDITYGTDRIAHYARQAQNIHL